MSARVRNLSTRGVESDSASSYALEPSRQSLPHSLPSQEGETEEGMPDPSDMRASEICGFNDLKDIRFVSMMTPRGNRASTFFYIRKGAAE